MQSSPNLQTTFQCDRPVALVTGSGAERVGREVVTALASAGCRVAIHAHRSTSQAEQLAAGLRDAGSEAIVLVADLAQSVEVETMVAEVIRHYGRIDILVNSAAIWQPRPLEQVSADELRRYFEINAVGSFVAARAAGLAMVDQPSGGAIVNIGDWATVRPYLDHAAYFPSKGAIEAMTRSLAVELGHRNPRVRVNCLLPGPVLLADSVPLARRERIARGVLAGRVGTPREVAHAVRFLCENPFVTGIVLPVDGGRSIFANDGLQVGMNTG